MAMNTVAYELRFGLSWYGQTFFLHKGDAKGNKIKIALGQPNMSAGTMTQSPQWAPLKTISLTVSWFITQVGV